MSDDGGGGPTARPKRLSCSLATEFTLSPGKEDVVCVDLEGEWSEDSKVSRHPNFDNKSLEFVKGEVGEGGDHMNVTFKNIGEESVTIAGDEVVIVVTEDKDEDMKNTENKDDSSKTVEQSSPAKPEEVQVPKDTPEVSEGTSEEKTNADDAVMETDSETKNDTSSILESKEDEVVSEARESTPKVDDKEANVIDEDKNESNTEPDKEESTKEDDKEPSMTIEEVKGDEEVAAIVPPFRDETQSTPVKETDKVITEKVEDHKVTEVDDTAENSPSKIEDKEESNKMETNEEEIKDKDSSKKDEAPSPKMRFVNESEVDNKVDASKDLAETKIGETEESMDTGDVSNKSKENVEEMDTKDNSNEEKSSVDESKTIATESTEKPTDNGDKSEAPAEKKDDKPTLKLASFSSMGQPSQQSQNGALSPVKGESKSIQGGGTEGAKQDACSHCARGLNNIYQSIVWETMQFCDENCLGQYQSGMSHCSSCKKDVQATSLGKYCVRFGSDIKQFCSNVCLEDYKKGLKVCSYCQKDISGGEGFLAPIGDKGQFKDFCEQSCLQKYEHMHLGKKPEDEVLPCSVCKETKVVVQEILREKEMVKLCSDPCFSAFKFVNSVDTHQCDLCTKHFDVLIPKIHIYYDGLSKIFCSKPCQNVFVMQKRKIVPCAYCKVKKYNFDMIEKFPPGQTTNSHLYCSLNCLNLHNMQMVKMGTIQGGATTQGIQYPGYSPRPAAPLPVISAVSSLAVGGQQQQQSLQQQIQVQTQTVREVVKETHVLPSEVSTVKNKGMQTKPFMMTKGVSCRPHPCHKETQTEGLQQPVPIPIPVPIHVPTPCKMYNAPFPVPVPIPLPFPVPIFIPTTRHSMKGIEKIIKKILNKIPADPFEAELLALAGDIAGGGDSSDSESEPGDYAKDREYDTPLPAEPPAEDMENEMIAEKIVPKPLPISTPDPMDRQRMLHNQGYNMNKRRQSGRDEDSDPDDPDGTWRPKSLWEQQNPGAAMRGRRPNRGRGGRGGSPQVKRFRGDQTVTGREQQSAVQAIQQQPKERPDANHHLKFTYGMRLIRRFVGLCWFIQE